MKKADEMEMSVNFKATRLSWTIGLIFLLIWNIVGFIQTGEILTNAFVLMCLQCVVFFGSKLLFTKRLTDVKNNEE
ncbi:hypothetical protein SDC9_192778 [bioreactor metagenome]|uniref:Uncharacterized protein n=1 Tax=bioreactor metagenome TaxID=1076179 RepID=A0A645I1N8_9ZZZZ